MYFPDLIVTFVVVVQKNTQKHTKTHTHTHTQTVPQEFSIVTFHNFNNIRYGLDNNAVYATK